MSNQWKCLGGDEQVGGIGRGAWSPRREPLTLGEGAAENRPSDFFQPLAAIGGVWARRRWRGFAVFSSRNSAHEMPVAAAGRTNDLPTPAFKTRFVFAQMLDDLPRISWSGAGDVRRRNTRGGEPFFWPSAAARNGAWGKISIWRTEMDAPRRQDAQQNHREFVFSWRSGVMAFRNKRFA